MYITIPIQDITKLHVETIRAGADEILDEIELLNKQRIKQVLVGTD